MKIKVALSLLCLALLFWTAASARPGGFGGEGKSFGIRELHKKSGGGGGGCTAAPDGSVDLSECSNAFYIAVIL